MARVAVELIVPTLDDIQKHMDSLDSLVERSRKVDPQGESLVGALLKFSVADGYAYYAVVEDKGGDNFAVAHAPYLDAWTVHPALIRGLSRQDVIDQLERTRGMDRLFGRA